MSEATATAPASNNFSNSMRSMFGNTFELEPAPAPASNNFSNSMRSMFGNTFEVEPAPAPAPAPSRSEVLQAAADAWNVYGPTIDGQKVPIIDDFNTGHIYTPIQNLPAIRDYLADYSREFFRPGEYPLGPPIKLQQVRTYSHIWCPFIWRVLKLYKNMNNNLNIPEIPDEWLTYGHVANRINNLVGTTFRNSRQANNPEFYGIGNPNQQNYWDSVVLEALGNQTFMNGLLTSLGQAQAPAPAPARVQQQTSTTTGVPSQYNQTIRQALGKMIDFFAEDDLKRYIQQAYRQYPNNVDTGTAIVVSMLSGGAKKKRKNRKTKRRARKQKRKSTYRRRR